MTKLKTPEQQVGELKNTLEKSAGVIQALRIQVNKLAAENRRLRAQCERNSSEIAQIMATLRRGG